MSGESIREEGGSEELLYTLEGLSVIETSEFIRRSIQIDSRKVPRAGNLCKE
jgi:hypothetical protein